MPKLYISPTESKVLYQKYTQAGLSPFQANEHIKKVKKHLKELVNALRMNNKPDDEINLRFTEEFEKICQEAEAGIINNIERRKS